MDTSDIRVKVLDEVKLVPDDKLAELYDFVHYFRLGLQTPQGSIRQIMRFAGSWKDMPEEDFAQFSKEISQRRKQAFSGGCDV